VKNMQTKNSKRVVQLWLGGLLVLGLVALGVWLIVPLYTNEWCYFYRLNSAIDKWTKPVSSGCRPCQCTRMLNKAIVKASRAWK
jgi:hypothetical protein